MPRKKKTKEQKRKADERNAHALSTPHQETHQHVHATPTYAFAAHGHIPQQLQQHAMHADSVILVKKDVLKTAIISTAILIVQLVLFFLLKNHVLAIHFVSY